MTMEQKIDEVIDGLKIGLGTDEAHWESIESAVRVLEVIKGLQDNIVGLSDDDFESMILKAIKGD